MGKPTKIDKAKCTVCGKCIGESELSIDCGKKSQNSIHWTHLTCLQTSQLLNGAEVPLSKELYVFLEDKHFDYFCSFCKVDALPLPLQLVEQGVLTYSQMGSLGISTPEVNTLAQQQADKALAMAKELVKVKAQVSKLSVAAPVPPVETSSTSAAPGSNSDRDFFLMLMQQQKEQHDSVMQQQNAVMSQMMSTLERINANTTRSQESQSFRTDPVSAGSGAQLQNHSAIYSGHGDLRAPVGGLSKLPKIQMPIFHGDLLEWPSFWDTFSELVDRQTRFSNIEKLSYLKDHLSTEVQLVIKNLPLENKNYPIVVNILKSRFDDKDRIHTAHFRTLMELKPVKEIKIRELQIFVDTIEAHSRSLLDMADDDEELLDNQCVTIVPNLFEKLPVALRKTLFEKAGGDTVKNKLSCFRNVLQHQLKVEESIQSLSWTNASTTSGIASGGASSGQTKPRDKSTASGLLSSDSGQRNSKPKQKRFSQNGNHSKKGTLFCAFCQLSGSHRSAECQKYSSLQQRKEKISNLCRLCLRSGHRAKDCGNVKDCWHCGKRTHHTAFCFRIWNAQKDAAAGYAASAGKDQGPPAGSPVVLNSGSVVKKAVQNARSEFAQVYHGNEPVVMPTAVTDARNPSTGKSTKVSILFDSGSKRTYIDPRVAANLELEDSGASRSHVCTFGTNSSRELQTKICHVELSQADGSFLGLTAHNSGAQITAPIIMESVPLSQKEKGEVKKFHLADSDFCFGRNFQIDILIGNDYLPMILKGSKHQLDKCGVYLLDTLFGWIGSGLIRGHSVNPTDSASLVLFGGSIGSKPLVLDDSCKPELESIWEFDAMSLPESKVVTQDDDMAWRMFNDTVKFEDGRVSVQWLKKDSIEQLPTNFPVALHRLRTLLHKLEKHPEYHALYAKNFDDQLSKGIIEKVTPEMTGNLTHYIPHHAVITPDKHTTKMRVVFDASAKLNKQSVSLNECLFRGPNLLSDLCGLLLKFRTYNIAITADIEKAFLQVNLQESERDLTRFLWLKDPTNLSLEGNMQIFRFRRVPFGFKTSPFLLTGAIIHLLNLVADSKSSAKVDGKNPKVDGKNPKDKRPHKTPKPVNQEEVAGGKQSEPTAEEMQALVANLYVDNYVTGVDTVEAAKETYKNPGLADVEMAEAVQSLMQATPVIENIHVGQETVSKAGVGQSSAAAQGQGSLVPTAGSRVSPLEKELPGPTKTITKAAKKDWWMQKNRRADRRCEAEGCNRTIKAKFKPCLCQVRKEAKGVKVATPESGTFTTFEKTSSGFKYTCKN